MKRTFILIFLSFIVLGIALISPIGILADEDDDSKKESSNSGSEDSSDSESDSSGSDSSSGSSDNKDSKSDSDKSRSSGGGGGGGQGSKGVTTLCHIPPGNHDAKHTITVGASAVKAHIGKHGGDTLGACGGNGNETGNGGNQTVDTQSPQWFNNSTNSTLNGTLIEHRVMWTDNVNLSGFIFSFDNGTGTFVNDSFVSMIGTNNWSNVSKVVNSTAGTIIRWRVYANDTSNNLTETEVFSYTTTSVSDTIAPTIIINSPTNSTFATGNIDYNITLDEALDFAFYSVDSGSNFTLDNDSNTHYFNISGNHPTLSEGFHNITFWVNDTDGNANESTIFFTVNTTVN